MEQKKPERKATLSRIPWKAFLANMGVVGAAHGLGYMTSGITSEALGRAPGIRRAWNRMSPSQQRAMATGLVGATGAAIPLSIAATQLATQANLQEAMERKRAEQGSKVASVIMVYQAALEKG